MKIFKVGDQIDAICNQCASLKKAEFTLRDMPFSDNSGIAKNILVAACNQCNEVVLVPQQSAPAINKQLPQSKKPIESRVPAHMIDILNVASEKLGATTEFSVALVKFYLHTLAEKPAESTHLKAYLDSELASGKSQKRISLKGNQAAENIETIKVRDKLQNTSNVIKAVVLKINDDLLANPKPDVISQLKTLAAVHAA